jgi:signal transduction histidine kinase
MTGPAPDWPALFALAVHELRSPASVISGYVAMLLSGHGGTLGAAQREALEQASHSCDRLAELLAGVSEVAQLGSGRLALATNQVDLGDLLDAASMTYAPAAGATTRLAVALPRQACTVTGDRLRLSRALAALAALVARNCGDDANVVAAGSRIGAQAVITISSATNHVVPEAVGELMPLDELGGGLGLAVPLARMVIEASGGRLGVPANAAGATTAAVVILPAMVPGQPA